MARLFHPWEWQERLDSLEAEADSAAADSAAADTAAPGGAERREGAPAGVPAGQQPTARGGTGSLLEGPLPERELVALLDGPLSPDVPYRLTVSGVRNVALLEGGGGSVLVTREPPRQPAAPPDSAGALPDTTGARPDTTGAPPDTTVAPPARPSLRTPPRPSAGPAPNGDAPGTSPRARRPPRGPPGP